MPDTARRWRYVAIGFLILEATSLMNSAISGATLSRARICPVVPLMLISTEKLPHKQFDRVHADL